MADDARRGTTRAWVALGAAVLAYTIAVLQRTSLSVAGLDAAERFHASASIISTFIVLQLFVYSLMQVPAGVLLDRFGSRALLTTGAAIMAMGQVTMAYADEVPTAVIARVLIGVGDSMTFGSLLRLIPSWFTGRQIPVLTQTVPLVGQCGQIAAAAPLAWSLHSRGWTPTFLTLVLAAVSASALTFLVVRNRPAQLGSPPDPTSPTQSDEESAPERSTTTHMRAVLAEPGNHLGMWTHFTSGFPPIVFSMLWGYPWLTRGEGLSRDAATGLITWFVIAGMVFGPLVGSLIARYPMRRSALVFAIVGLNLVVWAATLTWPGPAPVPLLVVLVASLALGGPGSGVGFDFARSFNPPDRLGTATGIVIMGGFFAALLNILIVGLVLDVLRPDGDFDLVSFRIAMATQVPFWVLGIVMMVRARRRVRAATGIAPADSALEALWRHLHGAARHPEEKP